MQVLESRQVFKLRLISFFARPWQLSSDKTILGFRIEQFTHREALFLILHISSVGSVALALRSV